MNKRKSSGLSINGKLRVDMIKVEKIYLNGAWVRPHGSERAALENPATRVHFASVPLCDETDALAAVEGAAKAFLQWSRTPFAERIERMERMLTVFESMHDEIVKLEAKELGAPVFFSRYAHCQRQFERIRAFIDAAREFKCCECFRASTVLREPIGVVAAITPWNYPIGQIVQKVVPAVLMGNTVVLKPSTNTPLTALLLLQAFEKVGFPAGVVNLLIGRGSELGRILCTHPKVAMVSFTGSTDVGRDIARLASHSVKRLALELGGKSPYIWLKSRDYRAAVPKLVSSIFYNSGQTCTALSRLIVPEEDLADIEALLKEEVAKLKVGDPMDPDTHLGPVASRSQFETVKSYIELGIREGARLVCGGVPEAPQKGYFIVPTVFSDVKNTMRIAREEIFGPVLCVIPYRTVDEAVEIANDSDYGLSAAVYGENREACLEVAARIESGGVYINGAHRDDTAPFGGCKQSGYGREGGREGLLEFTQAKTIYDN